MKKDARYSIQKEYCGYKNAQWVVRFCGDWIAVCSDKKEANQVASNHAKQREIAMTIDRFSLAHNK